MGKWSTSLRRKPPVSIGSLGLVAGMALGQLAFTSGVLAAGPCGPPVTSLIACENSQPGTDPTIWDVSGGNAGDPTIQGFASDLSVNVGGTISFKIKTDTTSYSVDIYRLGYYQGNGARLIATLSPSATLPQHQPACLTNPPTGLIDCGNWAVSASWSVPPNAVSGIYLAKLTDNVGGGASHIPFIVRNDASTSDIVFRTNDTTWVAYNSYGGNSLYYGTGGSSDGRAYKVSYNRPFNDRSQAPGDGAANYLFYGEFPMVRWLEMNGYDVSYESTVDVERNASLLRNHHVLLSSGHDEYWSAGERAAVQGARDAGVNIAQFTGNTGFWKTRWESSIDGLGTPYRTLVSYKETLDNTVLDPLDPPTWTGSWRDPRFSPPADGGQPENALNGTIFMVNRGSAAPVITSDYAPLRFWRNTAVATLAAGQTVTLGAQTIGYEWDEDLDNGFRPPGLIDLSSTTVSVPELLQDNGATYKPGTAIHHLTLYRASSGALVFSSGTVQWAWGLDIHHDVAPDSGPSVPDQNMQQATVNLLADMGAQPATLEANLVAATASTDTTPPTSSITSPTTGASIVTGNSVTVTGTAADTGGSVAGVAVSVDGGTTWHPATGTTSWSYTFTAGAPASTTIKSRAVDDSGNIESPSAGSSVTITPHSCPCGLFNSTATPATTASPDSSAIELGVKFSVDNPGYVTGVRFYKSSQNTGSHTGSLWTTTGTLLANGTFTNETASGWQQLTFSTAVAIQPKTLYVASYHTDNGFYSSSSAYFSSPLDYWPTHAPSGSNGVFAYGGSQFPTQSYNSTNYWVDVVVSTSSGTPTSPTVASVTPSPGAPNVSLAMPLSANFSEDVVPSTIQFAVTGPGGATLPGSVSYTSSTWTTTFTPGAQLTEGTTYTATISGARDQAGSVMSAPYSWSFTTLSCPCMLFAPSATPAVSSSGDTSAIELGVKFQSDVNGYVTAIRFYKGSGNAGTHVGNLWSSSGQLLATATFSGESATGWQQVRFSAPVAVSANTLYLASYHTDAGNYSYTSKAFMSATANGPLHTQAGNNGVYAYGASQFPTQSYNSTNYWVDLLFDTTSGTVTRPSVVSTSPAANGTDVGTGVAVNATFNKSVVASSIHFTVTNPTSASVAGTLTYNDTTLIASFQPNLALAKSTTYTATVSGATDASGNTLASPVSWSFTTMTCCSVFSGSATPTTVSVNDPGAVELGMKFTSDVGGTITAVRFYKSPSNVGTHVGNLWSSAGQLLATATFSNETASGWQQVALSPAVAITAGATYVVSYHTNTGFYSADSGTFASAVDNPPLHALANSVSSNGIYAYGVTQFPTQSFGASNYWVDVIFTPSQSAPTPPAVVSTSPAASATWSSLGGAITGTFNHSVVASSIQFTVTGPGNVGIAGTLLYDDVAVRASFQPNATLTPGTTYTATISGATDSSGTAMTAPFNWSFTTVSCPCTLFSASATPAVSSSGDTNAIELGVKFSADVGGYVTGIRFYKGGSNTGTHVGTLWSSTGQPLATGTFTNETASGWQQVSFGTPVAITANTVYVASYHTDAGNYAFTSSGFAAGIDNGSLHAPSGSNGVFGYGPSHFPTQSYNSTNYWVDLVFDTANAATTPPAVVTTSPAANAIGVALNAAITATFNKSVVASSIGFAVTGPGGAAVAGTLTYTDSSRTASFQPSTTLAAGSVYTTTISGAADASGTAMTAPTTWSFTTLQCPCSVFAPNATPGTVTVNDPVAVELGMKFTADVNGQVTGIRFYKGPFNTGTHVGNLWTTAGQLLGTVTFANETASGWQQATFPTPIAITAGTTYMISYHTNTGNYSADGRVFASAVDNPPLHGVASGVSANGAYSYGGTQFPTQSFNATNYWVDVVFSPS